MEQLLRRIETGEIDPSRVISHRIAIEEAPAAYRAFRDKEDECIKYVVSPNGAFERGNGKGHRHDATPAHS
jgi:threonine dehydrogenase-like Zn-dependent dehydrogenase